MDSQDIKRRMEYSVNPPL